MKPELTNEVHVTPIHTRSMESAVMKLMVLQKVNILLQEENESLRAKITALEFAAEEWAVLAKV